MSFSKTIISLFRKKRKPSFEQIRIEADNEYKQLLQKDEDERLERAAKREGLDMFEQWLNGNLIIVPRPQTTFIKCYYPYESKYDSKSYNQMASNHFNELKNQHTKKHGTDSNGRMGYGGK